MVKEIDRRTLLKSLTVGALGFGSVVAFGDLIDVFAAPGGQKIALARAIILIDMSLCSGCRIC